MNISNFIKKNNLCLDEGTRNSAIVILIGYSQFKNLEKDNLIEELSSYIEKDCFIEEEIDRLWDYCYKKNYSNFWTTDEATKRYKF
jgi:hypothetical protein